MILLLKRQVRIMSTAHFDQWLECIKESITTDTQDGDSQTDICTDNHFERGANPEGTCRGNLEAPVT